MVAVLVIVREIRTVVSAQVAAQDRLIDLDIALVRTTGLRQAGITSGKPTARALTRAGARTARLEREPKPDSPPPLPRYQAARPAGAAEVLEPRLAAFLAPKTLEPEPTSDSKLRAPDSELKAPDSERKGPALGPKTPRPAAAADRG